MPTKSSVGKTLPNTSAELVVESPREVDSDHIELGANFVEPAGNHHRIWFRFPRDCASLLTRRADPFVIATAVHAVQRYRSIHIRGTVSEGLLANLADFQSAFATFHSLPRVEPVDYTATDTAAAAGIARRPMGISAFSGGVDSCFSIFQHTGLSSFTPKRPLGAALMMHGFDIPLAQADTFARSAARSKQMTDNAGLRFFTGATNVRTLPVAWEDTFGAVVAGSLSFFQPAYTFGLIPSCQDWTKMRLKTGSNPLMDPLLSSSSFQLIHDGTSFGRIEKLRRLASWPGALRHLRVCWQGAQLDRNCGQCEKCLRTMMMLEVCGVNESDAFPRTISIEALNKLTVTSQGAIDEFGYLLSEAKRLGMQKPWMKPVARVLTRSERKRRLWQQGKSIAALMPSPWQGVLGRAGRRWLGRNPAPASSSLKTDAAGSL